MIERPYSTEFKLDTNWPGYLNTTPVAHESKVKSFRLSFVYDPCNESDQKDGFEKSTDDSLNVFKLGPVYVVWGLE